MEEVVTAIRALHETGPVSYERRGEVDRWLRHWREMKEAWHTANEILRHPHEPEVRIFAAITLRHKITYDFGELQASDSQSLLQSVLDHLQRCEGDRQLMCNLAHALALLSVQMAETWSDPLQTVMARFGQNPATEHIFLEFVRVLPDESGARELITNPQNKAVHSEILKNSAPEVLQWLDAKLLRVPAGDQEALSAVLESFVEWLSWSHAESEAVLSHFTRHCCDLFQNPAGDTQIHENAADCLDQILRECRKRPFGRCRLLHYLLSALAGPIADITMHNIELQDWDAVALSCKLYNGAGKTLAICFAYHGTRVPELRRMSELIFQLTFLPLRVDDPSARHGTELLMGFWYSLLAVGIQVKGTMDMGSAVALLNGEALQFVGETFASTLPHFVRLCQMPDSLHDGDSRDTALDFNSFREEIIGFIEDLHGFLGFQKIIDTIVGLLSSGEDLARREACLYCLSRVVAFAETTLRPPPAVLASELEALGPILKNVPSLLGTQPPSSFLDHQIREFTVELVNVATRAGLTTTDPETIPRVMDAVAAQLFFDANFAGALPSTTFESDLSSLQRLAAQTFKVICEQCAYLPAFQAVSKDLILALYTKFESLKDGAFEAVLEGVASTFAHMASDADFLFAIEQVCNPLVASILDPQLSDSALCVQLGRLASVLKFTRLAPPAAHGVTKTDEMRLHEETRRASMAQFVNTKLWPMMKSLMESRIDSSNAIERIGRILKHSMRVIGSAFRPVVEDFMETLMTCSRQRFYCTFLYAAEWLVTQFYHDESLAPQIAVLFQQLTNAGFENLSAGLKEKKASHLQYLIEDYFGLFCRYQKFAPLIAASSPTLELTFEILYPCMTVPDKETLNTVFGFVDSIIALLRGLEEGQCDEANGGALLRGVVERKVRPLLLSQLGNLVRELVSIVAGQPSDAGFNHVCSIYYGLKEIVPPELLAERTATALASLPVKVLPSDDVKTRILESLLSPQWDPMENAFRELEFRCRQQIFRSQK